MTPFDPVALVAMLVVFYSPPSLANLQRARAERPEYFAAGRLGSTGGEKLFLPDGRIFDLVFAVEGPVAQRRYQALDVTNATGGAPDLFPLEPGPLDPIDETLVILPPRPSEFTDLVAEELDAFGGSDAVLESAAAAVVEFGDGAALDAAFEREIEPAAAHHAAFRAALDGDDIADEIAITDAQGGAIVGARTSLDDDAPSDLQEPDPGPPPDATGDPIPPGTPDEPPG